MSVPGVRAHCLDRPGPPYDAFDDASAAAWTCRGDKKQTGEFGNVRSDHSASRRGRAGRAAHAKKAVASWIGSAVEYYDFFIYGTAAALVFGKIFFPSSDPAMATIAAFATFGVGYLTRPIGAVILGHVGDKFGRKKVLTFTLLLMGLSTFLVGPAAHLRPGRRMRAHPAGVPAAAAGAFRRRRAGRRQLHDAGARPRRPPRLLHLVHAQRHAGRPDPGHPGVPAACRSCRRTDLLSWGWRIPFFLSAIVVAVGFWVRRTLPETPAFEAEETSHEVARLPMAVLFRDQSARRAARDLRGAGVRGQHHLQRVHALLRRQHGAHLALHHADGAGAGQRRGARRHPGLGVLSDRIGRRPVFIVRRARLRRADLAVHLGDQPGQRRR